MYAQTRICLRNETHCCIDVIQLHMYIYIMRNIIKHNDELLWTNEHTSLYISHTLFSKGVMLVVCVRWAEDGDRLLHWPSSTSFSSWLGCSTMGYWGPKALCLLLALNSASCLQLTWTVWHLVILLFNAHLLPLFFRLFTLVHLLIDCLVEGQYITPWLESAEMFLRSECKRGVSIGPLTNERLTGIRWL